MKTKFLPAHWFVETFDTGRPAKYVFVFYKTVAKANLPSFKVCKDLFKIYNLNFKVIYRPKTSYEIQIFNVEEFPIAYHLVFGGKI